MSLVDAAVLVSRRKLLMSSLSLDPYDRYEVEDPNDPLGETASRLESPSALSFDSASVLVEWLSEGQHGNLCRRVSDFPLLPGCR